MLHGTRTIPVGELWELEGLSGVEGDVIRLIAEALGVSLESAHV